MLMVGLKGKNLNEFSAINRLYLQVSLQILNNSWVRNVDEEVETTIVPELNQVFRMANQHRN